jgi:hypothetical protein
MLVPQLERGFLHNEIRIQILVGRKEKCPTTMVVEEFMEIQGPFAL